MVLNKHSLTTEDLNDEETLRILYKVRNYNKTELADIYDCHRSTIRRYINKYNIKKVWEDEELMETLMEDKGFSTIEISDMFNCGQSSIGRAKLEFELEGNANPRKKPPHHHWDSRGYEIVCCDNGKKKRQVYIHRLVAVAEYGIEAVKENDVHHINGVKWDNRPSNIEVISPQEHGKIHREEQIAKGLN
jgi:transposase